MSMIPDDIIEQVRDGADLIGIIGETVELKRTGSDYRGPCPFHGGTHRNFAVIPRKGLFYCYVCHEKGDVFSYFMKRFGMDYPSAVREVARRSGIVIPDRPARAGPDPHEPLFSAVAAAQDWFARQLLERPDAQVARDYLAGRALPLDAAAPLGLGFAPAGKDFLGAMGQLGISEQMLLEAGLAVKREDGSMGARFRSRLLFPIHDLRGRAVGFGGRLLAPGEPKYLNSPETEIFHKGKLLYNLHQAKNAIRKEEVVIVVEGYFDALRLVLAGIDHVVAPLGTALTADQAILLRRYAPAAILLYDSDQAGLRATFRAGDELLRRQVRVRVATMPAGEDPDTLVRSGGAAALAPVLRDAIDVLERKIQLLERKGWFEGVEHRRDALDRLLPTIRAAADPITRQLYLSLAAERTGVSKEVLEREASVQPSVSVTPPPSAPGDSRQPPQRSPRPRRVSGAERDLLRVLIDAPHWLDRARAEVRPEWFECGEFREIYDGLLRGGAKADPATMVADLSPDAQRAWTWLRESAARLGAVDPDRTYAEVCKTLEARPYLREYRAVKSRSLGASGGELPDVLSEMMRLRREIRTRFPEEWRKRFHRKSSEGNLPPDSRAQRRPNAS